MSQDGKPRVLLRMEVMKDAIIFLDPKRVKNMHSKTLKKSEEYYESVLEAYCGKQVWDLLESLTAVQEELNSRKPMSKADYEKYKEQVFAELDRNYKKNGPGRRAI